MSAIDDKYGEETVVSPETRTYINEMTSWMRVSAIIVVILGLMAILTGILWQYAGWVDYQQQGDDGFWVFIIMGLLFLVPGLGAVVAGILRMRAVKLYYQFIEKPQERLFNAALRDQRKYLLMAVVLNVLMLLVCGTVLVILVFAIFEKRL